METLCFRFASLLVITVLLPLLALSAAYTLPEKFYINCGSDSNVTYGNRIFVGDMISNTNSVSFSSRGSEINNQSGSSTTPGIYRSVRIFRRSSSYKFRIDPLGLHFVRLHFSAVSRELSTASFTVSAKPHFQSFSLRNFNETPRVEEFLLMINKPEFKIRFEPSPSSVAFVNAIEVFFAPNNTIPSNAGDKLRTVYRLNVGGKKITPENDTLGRTWLLDDDFLYGKDSAKNIQSTQKPNYEGGSVSATDYTAPDFVYQTAKTMKRRSMKGAERQVLMNLTWSFKVKTETSYFIRFHFCDILNNSQSSDYDFYLYVNGQWREDVQPSTMSRLVTPFYKDVVNISDGSGLLNVSIRNKVAETDAAFLNGLEVMEFLKISSGPDSSSSYRAHIIAGCVAAAFVLVLCLLFVVFLKRRSNKKKKKKTTPDAEVSVWSALPLQKGGSSDHTSSYPVNNSPLRNLHLGLKIPLSDILSATDNFDEQWLIGRGGFGDVYKSTLPNGSKAAIKRGKTSSGQGILEFQTEIQVLSRIRHRHLVSLTGYCEENSEMILVYEFMEKGTLREHLYGSDLPPLTWKQRIEICIGAAGGLRYLHEEAIIHRDVKSTNILLDENNVAKVADFGLSKLAANRDQSNISTNIKGTFGYLDPEYLQTHLLTEKSDVFAFGVVLLEVLCARPALDTTVPHEEEVNLAEWFMFCKSKGVTNEIIDPKLMGQIEPSSLRKFMETAEKCLKEYGEERPSMADVKWDLEYALQLQVMTTQREPHEDSAVTISGGSSLVIPRLMVNDSFSSNSFVPRNEVKSSHGGTTTDSSESRVFSQLNMSEAR